MFKAAKVKLDRADKHIADLGREFAAFSTATPAPVLVVSEDGTLNTTIGAPPLPAHIAAALGDAVNNLRTSLDMLAHDLAKPGTKHKFPFGKDKADFPKRMKESGIASQAVRDYIEHAVMPYKGGDNDVWALHDTDIINKHHTLIPTASSAEVTMIYTMRAAPATNCTSESGANLPNAPIWDTRVESSITKMYFTEESGFGRTPILEKLTALSKKLRRIITDIEGLLEKET